MGLRQLSLAMLIMAVLGNINIYSQDPLCILESETCLDLSSGSSLTDTITLPMNTTRVQADGINICLTDGFINRPPVDMIFVVDQSGSMVWNDETYYAPIATSLAVNYLAQQSPNSHAGLIPFAAGTCVIRNPQTVGTAPSLATIQGWISNDLADGTEPSSNGDDWTPADHTPGSGNWQSFLGTTKLGCDETKNGTHYITPMQAAETSLDNSSNTKKVVVFITDGEPNDDFDNWISTNTPAYPVYSVFIGGDVTYSDTNNITNAGGRLNNLSNITGGDYYALNANDGVALNNILNSIIDEVVAPTIPDSTYIRNTTNTQDAGSVAHTDLTNGKFQVTLGDFISLDSGRNVITITSKTTNAGNPQPDIIYTLVLDVDGTPIGTPGNNDAGDPTVDVNCIAPSSLIATDDNFNQITSLGYDATEFGIRLTTQSGITGATSNIFAINTSDAENLNLTSVGSNQFQALINYLSSLTNTNSNSRVEENIGGSVSFRWNHPRDTRDSATYTLPITTPKVANPQSTPAAPDTFVSTQSVQLFSASDNVNIYSGDSVEIYYTLNGDDPNTSAGGSTILYTGALTLVTSTLVKAVAIRRGWTNSDTVSFTFIKSFSQSRLEILDLNGLPYANNILDILNNQFAVKLSTNQSLAAYQPLSVTWNLNDNETLTMAGANNGPQGGFEYILQTNFNFSAGGSLQGGRVDANPFDTLVVTWTNPLDPSDVAADTIFIQSLDVASTVHFSTSNSLNDTVSSFNETNGTVFVIVNDPNFHPDSSYTVSLNTNTAESEVIPLTVQGNLLVGQINVGYNVINPGNNNLDVLLQGDVISATYTDLIYTTDVSQKSAVFQAKSVSDPYVNIPNGTFFDTDTQVIIYDTTAGALIRYTLEGSDPSHNSGTLITSGDSFFLDSSVILKIVAYIKNSDTNLIQSNIVSLTFNLKGQIGIPDVIPPGPIYFTEDTTILIIPRDTADTVVYTLDGSNPKTSGGTASADDTVTLVISQTLTLNVYARKGNATIPSGVRTEVYTKRDTLAPPVALPVTGTIFFDDTTVVLSHPSVTDARIYYTIDNTDPDQTSQVFVAANPLVFFNPTIIKAIAYGPTGSDQYVQSSVATFFYVPKVKTPTSVPGDTTFLTSLTANLFTQTTGADIYYSTDGINYSLYNQSLLFTSTTNLKAYATKAGWAPSDTITVVYTRPFTASNLEILGAFGQPITHLTEVDAAFSVNLQTSEVSLTTVSLQVIAFRNNDTDVVILSNQVTNANGKLFSGPIPFQVFPGAAVVNDGKATSLYYDSIIVNWVNPLNIGDVASDTMRVRPLAKNANIYFSQTLGGVSTEKYVTDQDTIYVMVQDQPSNPNANYSVILYTIPKFGNRTPDTLIIPITEITPGNFGVAIPVDKLGANLSSDNKLQAVKADVIVAGFVDPVDGDADIATVLYGEQGEVPGYMAFTDASYNVLADGVYWNPKADSVYLVYVDDYTLMPKILTLNVKNTNGAGTSKYDQLILNLGTPIQTDSIGTWLISVPMRELSTPVPGNPFIEVFFDAEITATLLSHTKNNLPSFGVADFLNVANPNDTAVIIIQDTSGFDVNRETEVVVITLNDQDFTDQIDTIYVDVQCLGSGDLLTNVIMIETDSGTYITHVIKNEGVTGDQTDSILTCLAEDEIRVTYSDPVYDERVIESQRWNSEVQTDIRIYKSPTEETDEINEWEQTFFYVRVRAFSASTDVVDTLAVVIKTLALSGDQVIIPVFETGRFTGIYTSGPIPFKFSTITNPADHIIEGALDPNSSNNQMRVEAALTAQGSYDADSVLIHSAYVPVDKAWIIDGNTDGSADTIYVQFQDTLLSLPDKITSIDWPAEGEQNLDADTSKNEIQFYVDPQGNIDSTLVMVIIEGVEDGEIFEKGISKPDQFNPPKLSLPDNPFFQNIEVEIQDSVGAVLIVADRKPSDRSVFEAGIVDGRTIYEYVPDTLVITLSEKVIPQINDQCIWDSLISFNYVGADKTCDKSRAIPLISYDCSQPQIIAETDSGIQYEFIVTNDPVYDKPYGNFCAWLNEDAPFMDENGNIPLEVKGDGKSINDDNSINDANVYNPVVAETGTGEGDLIFNEDNSIWLPPIGYNFNDGYQDLNAYDVCPNTVESQPSLTRFPRRCLSAIRVVGEGAYIAEVTIFDHLGKFIHASVQKFGICGELQDVYNRLDSDGIVSYLVWNTKATDGNFVGNGVYIWKVKYTSIDVNGNALSTKTEIYKQGVARYNMPTTFKECADDYN